ncbi:hypothetical protein ATANTOWER_012218 [Ataeniobius toweri]|uniref:Uncharacterized protein n=1 Tax=Ataeniobius toweri TaxID=208326 RepID=A0ABU7BTM5_9TELE|nr:hypothetical protein [Ataeniobius toweri]
MLMTAPRDRFSPLCSLLFYIYIAHKICGMSRGERPVDEEEIGMKIGENSMISHPFLLPPLLRSKGTPFLLFTRLPHIPQECVWRGDGSRPGRGSPSPSTQLFPLLWA